ncbi:IS630 family transposase [Hydrogenophaga sp.]|uniref:IS630 family transposase n=1 Tax=Hydrogenophaga sp. TaxID=1904254 RepID=UPI002728C682|nr:IS630 family transposase [Hydrogenophaga sp.]MDO9439140.1 IS630 family transposase [Hydrogenophaga sp.]
MRVAEMIELDAQTERELRALSKGRRVEARVQQRASVILLAAEGWQNKDIADRVMLDRRQVAMWRRRFIEGGLEALRQDAVRTGRTPSVTQALETHIVSTTLHERPPDATQWSSRSLAAHLGLSATTIRRVWQRNGIKPHEHAATQVLREHPRFEDKLIDVVGLRMSPPEHALVFSYGEAGSALASHRARPVPPPPSPESAGATDIQRVGTITLFAALDALDRAVVAIGQKRQQHEEWLRFLRLVDHQTPPHLQLHVIVDNAATHKHPQVQAWLARQPRVVVHFAPTGASWLDTVKRFFRDIAEHRLRRESFACVSSLQKAMAQHLKYHDPASGIPFIWTAGSAESAKLTRSKAARTVALR